MWRYTSVSVFTGFILIINSISQGDCAVTVRLDNDFGAGFGYFLVLTLVPDTTFTGGFEVLVQLAGPADLSVSTFSS